MSRGYFGIGILNAKKIHNLGTLWRSAANLGADFIFTIGQKYKHQSSDTVKAWRHIPLYRHETFADFYGSIPYDCRLVGVEIEDRAVDLPDFTHPERCIYLLGAEDNGLTREAIDACHSIVSIPSVQCLNVSVAGALVMYDRQTKAARRVSIPRLAGAA